MKKIKSFKHQPKLTNEVDTVANANPKTLTKDKQTMSLNLKQWERKDSGMVL